MLQTRCHSIVDAPFRPQRLRFLALQLPQHIARGVQVGHATAHPEVGHGGARLAANQAGLDSRSATSSASTIRSRPLITAGTLGSTPAAMRSRTLARSCALVIAIASPLSRSGR